MRLLLLCVSCTDDQHSMCTVAASVPIVAIQLLLGLCIVSLKRSTLKLALVTPRFNAAGAKPCVPLQQAQLQRSACDRRALRW
jgi:hypothetical protein